jgi:hypothetical protein
MGLSYRTQKAGIYLLFLIYIFNRYNQIVNSRPYLFLSTVKNMIPAPPYITAAPQTAMCMP